MFKKLVFVSLLFLITTGAMAQSQDSSYTVTVITKFSPTISDAQQKINEKAVIVDTNKIKKEVTYSIFSPAYTSQFIPEEIAAPKVGRDQISRLYRNFIKFGIGYPWTPYLDFEINSLRSTRYAFGVRAFHHSTFGGVKGYAPAHHSDSRIGVFGQKFFNDYTLYASADYNHLMATCYGFQPDSVLPEGSDYKIKAKDIRRQYHHIHANVNFSRNAPKDAHVFNQFYGIDYNFVNENSEGSIEHQLAFKTDLNKDIKVAKITYLNFGGEFGMNYYNNQWFEDLLITDVNGNIVEAKNNFEDFTLNFKPYASLNYKEYFLKAGFNITMLFSNGETKPYFHPDIQARLHIVPNIFTVYAGIDGGLKRNSYLSYIQENPYLSDFLTTGFMNEQLRFFGGVKVGLSRSLSIGAKASYSFCDNMPFFINNTQQSILITPSDGVKATFLIYPNNTFEVVLDNSQFANLHFDLSYTYKQQFYLMLNLDYNHYSTTDAENMQRPWYKPAFVGNLDMRYILLNKFVFNLATFIYAGIPYPEFIDGNIKPETLRPAFDFNFGFEYLWSKRLSFFANINNFAYQRNYYYHDYPSQRINCLIGVKYNFGGETIGKK